MRQTSIFLFLAMVMAALFAFSGSFSSYPIYYNEVTIAPYQFADFLFWMFLLLFLAAVLFNSRSPRRPLPPEEQMRNANPLRVEEDTSGSFTWAVFLLVIAVISGLFGFGVIASAMAGLAMVIFWIAIAVGLVAVAMGLNDHGHHPRPH